MRWVLLSLAVAIALTFVGTLPLLRRPRPAKALPVTAKPLLSQPEQLLYGRLVRAFPGHVILAQVVLSQLLVVDRADLDGSAHSMANRIRQLVADFVVCAPDFTAVAVVELEDRSHARNVRKRNRRKDRFLQEAGIKVIRFTDSDIPSEAALRALVAAMPLTWGPTQLARRA